MQPLKFKTWQYLQMLSNGFSPTKETKSRIAIFNTQKRSRI